VLVPHLGSATVDTRERMAMRAVTNVEAALRGGVDVVQLRDKELPADGLVPSPRLIVGRVVDIDTKEAA